MTTVCHFFVVPGVRILVGAAVNCFGIANPVVKWASVGLRSCRQSWSCCVHLEAAEFGSFGCSLNTNTPLLLLQVPGPGKCTT